MNINGINISKFNATQLKVDIQPSNIQVEKDWYKNSLMPIVVSSKTTFKKITAELYFRGERELVLNNISDCLSLLRNKSNIKFIGYSNNYLCFLEESEIEKTIQKDRYKLILSFSGIEFGNKVTEAMNQIKTKTINVSGNMETPVVLEITPIIDTIEVNIEGLSDDPLVVKNLKQDKTLIINGINGTVTQDGANRFADVDMWEFPFLVPGLNKITVSKDTCNINIKYNPRFL